ncbi:LysM peptidoglycan-binding domain-containing protein [Myxococcus stipitatus]|uniref:LysM peptidoglycan-binding domain-containing protein n=1 Tax=Myxococcus stipitatus TaxID=83455 RepID=UPI0031455E81
MTSLHSIQRGDTLGKLAQKFQTSVQALAKANNLKDPNLIIAGKSLRIPDGFDDRPFRVGSASTGASAGTSKAKTADSTTERSTGSGGPKPGKGWGGSEGMADAAKKIAKEMGIPVTSQKRDAQKTKQVNSNKGSDHYTGNKKAFAVDFGASGKQGDKLAKAIAKKYGIPESSIGTYKKHTVEVDGKKYALQLLWKVKGHFDHVHLGIRRLD